MASIAVRTNSSFLTSERMATFARALSAMAEFRQVFGRRLDEPVVAEIWVAQELGLEMSPRVNEPGFDLIDPTGVRYQVKYRSINTQNVDVNNFDFDYLVLVNLDEDYRLTGMWCITVEQARRIFTPRNKFRKFQATQKKVKATTERIR